MRENVYSVSQVNKYIKNMFLTDYMLQNLEVRGEVSNLKYHSSGHIYFTLKDEKSAIKCVMFAGSRRTGLDFMLKEGMAIIVNGNFDVYERDGSYQLYAKSIKADGVGNLFEQFEKLKEKLSEQGMFDPMYKKEIPSFARTLGVVTASTGAAVRDIIDVSKRRNPGIEIVLFPAIVQGADAPLSIIKGIKALEKYGVDVIIVGRGGGSMEDLWGFNDEGVAQAIFDCSIPIISAVGHETDFTIADFVSDLRAPTPSAAAELAVCDVRSVAKAVSDYRSTLTKDMNRKLQDLRIRSARLGETVSMLSPEEKLKRHKNKLENIKTMLNKDIKSIVMINKHRLEINAGRLHGLSPLVKLQSGYAHIADQNHKTIKSVKNVSINDTVTISVADGVIESVVTAVKEDEWTKKS